MRLASHIVYSYSYLTQYDWVDMHICKYYFAFLTKMITLKSPATQISKHNATKRRSLALKTKRTPRARALLIAITFYLLASFSIAQVPKLNDQPVLISIESYLVQERETEEGQVQEWFERVNEANPNDLIEVRLTVSSEAESPLPAATLLVTMPIPEGMTYVEKSATPSSSLVMLEFSKDTSLFAENLFHTVTIDDTEKRLPVPNEDYRAIRWTVLDDFEPEDELTLFYRLRVLEPDSETEQKTERETEPETDDEQNN